MTEVESCIKILEQSGEYKVLQRLNFDFSDLEPITDPKIGVIVDVETTGLDCDADEIIEIALVKIEFSHEGRIGKVLSQFQSYNEPSKPIPPNISDLTGIKDIDVKNKRIDKESLETFLAGVTLVVAHNAAFDRPFCEKISRRFSELSWACTAMEIPWDKELIGSRKLEYIAFKYGAFYQAHRAMDDCQAVLRILCSRLPQSRKLAIKALLENSLREEIRVFIGNTPYEAREQFKNRGYRWNGNTKEWWKSVSDTNLETEMKWLSESRNLSIRQESLTSKDRYKRA